MKKSLLLLVAGAIAIGANAQNTKSPVLYRNADASAAKKTGIITNQKNAAAMAHSAERTTSTCTFTEDFHSGTYTTMPTGWSAVTTSGPGTWHWTNSAYGGTITLPPLMSTTASNGWMIFNSDSLAGGTGMGAVVPAGYLQSPAYNCTSLATVVLSFQELYAKFEDSCWVEVSAAGGAYTTFRITLNDRLNDNEITGNPATIHVDISSVAATKANVVVRFVYSGPPGGGYSWNIDDVCIGPKNPDDVGAELSWLYEPNCTSTTGAFDGSMFNTPLIYVDSIYPVTRVSNFGANAEATVNMTAQIFNDGTGTLVYTFPAATYTGLTGYATLPVNAVDSFVEYSGYLPTAVGSYFCVMNANVTGDGDLTNNNDSLAFNVTDTTWQENLALPNTTEGYYVYHAAASTAFYEGARFDVPCGATGDTVSGFGVVFSSSSVVGAGTVTVQLYSTDKTVSPPAYTFLGSSVAKTLTAASFSTTSGAVWCDFRIDPTTYGYTPFILQAGNSYAAVVQCNLCTKDLVVCASDAFNGSGYAPGYFGQSDASGNDGGTTFGVSGDITNIGNIVPYVRMYNGKPPAISHVGVQNVTLDNNVGQAFPNPTNSDFTVPFTMGQDNKVVVTLTDVMGQVLNTQTVNAIGGQAAKAVFNTSNLATGMYIYTVQANGVNTTGRVVVSH